MRLISLHGKKQEQVVRTIFDNSRTIDLLTYLDEKNIEQVLKKPTTNYFDLGSKLVCFQASDRHYIPWDKIRFVRLAQ